LIERTYQKEKQRERERNETKIRTHFYYFFLHLSNLIILTFTSRVVNVRIIDFKDNVSMYKNWTITLFS